METIRIPQYTLREFAILLALSILMIPFGGWITRFEPSPESRRYEIIQSTREPVGYGVAAIGVLSLALLTYQMVIGKAGAMNVDLTPTELRDNRFGISVPWTAVRRIDYPEPPGDDGPPNVLERLDRLRNPHRYRDPVREMVVVLIHWAPAKSAEEEWERYPLALPTSMRGAAYNAKLRAAVEERTGLSAIPVPSVDLLKFIRKDAAAEFRRRYL